jgi:hypothetical protein
MVDGNKYRMHSTQGSRFFNNHQQQQQKQQQQQQHQQQRQRPPKAAAAGTSAGRVSASTTLTRELVHLSEASFFGAHAFPS